MSKRSHDEAAQRHARAAAAAAGAVPFKSKSGGGNSDIRFAHRAINPAYGGFRESHFAPGESQEDITLALDTTGSNKENAVDVYHDLPGFMDTLHRTGWLTGFSVQFATVNDLTSDGPMVTNTLSQFERDGATLDKWLAKTPLPGQGGGQKTETYELTFWQLVYQNKLDIWAKGGKGKLFMIFDEMPYQKISARLIRSMYEMEVPESTEEGDEISANQNRRTLDCGIVLPTKDIDTYEFVQNELLPKYDVFPIICSRSGYYNDSQVLNAWKKMFGAQAIIKVDDPSDITEAILAVLALQGGNDSIDIAAEIGKSLSAGVNADNFVKEMELVATAYGPVTPNVTATGLVPTNKNNLLPGTPKGGTHRLS